MAEVATAPENRHKLVAGASLVTAEMVSALEARIDELNERFEMPKEFVVPGQNRVSAALDVARTVVRRAERGFTGGVAGGGLAGRARISTGCRTCCGRWRAGRRASTWCRGRSGHAPARWYRSGVEPGAGAA